MSSRNKYIFNEPFSGRFNYFSSHTKFINPLPSVVVPYYKFKNILKAPSPTIPGELSICSQKMGDFNRDIHLLLNDCFLVINKPNHEEFRNLLGLFPL